MARPSLGSLQLAAGRQRGWVLTVLMVCCCSVVLDLPHAVGATVQVAVDEAARRSPPRFGFGNELVLQSTNDSNVAQALAISGGTIARYPGGTPADYWLWSEGWVNMTSHHPHSSQGQPYRQTTPAQWRGFLDKAGIHDSVLDLCQLTCSLEYELAGLRAHHAAGTPISYIELGNEMCVPTSKLHDGCSGLLGLMGVEWFIIHIGC